MPCHCENLHNGRKIAVLLSCPGRHELNAGRPAARQTGKNLEMVLNKLGLSRSEVAIDNASSKVFFKSLNHRTEAPLNEVLDPQNINRLDQELFPETKIILAMGNIPYEVAKALQKLHPDLIVVKSHHPGFCSLNHIKKDVNENDILRGDVDATQKRVDVIVEDILSQTKYFTIK